MHSPVATTAVAAATAFAMAPGGDTSPSQRSRPPVRPTSWDSSREFKPLYLIEHTAQQSAAGAAAVADGAALVELPPSEPPSEPASEPESPGTDVDLGADGEVEYLSLEGAEGLGLVGGSALMGVGMGDGVVRFVGEEDGGDGSGETTPRAGEGATGGEPFARELVAALEGLPEETPSEAASVDEEREILVEDQEIPVQQPEILTVPVEGEQIPAQQEREMLPASPSPAESRLDAAPLPELEPELEELPALPQSAPASPTLAAAPEEPLPLPVVEDELPALPESQPGSLTLGTFSLLHVKTTTLTTRSARSVPTTVVEEEPEFVPDAERSPSLSKSRPVSPVLGMFLPPTQAS